MEERGHPGRPILHSHSCSVPQVWLHEAPGSSWGHPALPYSQGSATATVQLQAPPSTEASAPGCRPSPSPQPSRHDAKCRQGQEEGTVWLASPPPSSPRGGRPRSRAEEAECHRQFRAQPVPAHVYLPSTRRSWSTMRRAGGRGSRRGRELLLFLEALQLPEKGRAEKASYSCRGTWLATPLQPKSLPGHQEDPCPFWSQLRDKLQGVKISLTSCPSRPEVLSGCCGGESAQGSAWPQ